MYGARATIACVLAWLALGAGHLYLGRRLRAAVFFVVVMTTFSLGLAFEGKPSVIDRRQPLLSYLQVFANVGTGPMEAVAREKIFGQLAYRLPPEDAGPDPTAPSDSSCGAGPSPRRPPTAPLTSGRRG